MIRCIIVDDEPLARQGVKLALAPHRDFLEIGEFGSVDETLQKADLANVHVVFLDIEMPRQQGFDLLEQWQGPLPLVVFVTAYNQYAVRAFEKEALDYVLKPIDDARFARVINRIRERIADGKAKEEAASALKAVSNLRNLLHKREAAAISVKTEDGYLRVPLDDIYYLEAARDHTFLYLKDRHLITRQTLKHYAAELSAHGFYQVHKSYLVNRAHVSGVQRLKFGDQEILLSDGRTFRMSRRYKSVLQELLPSDT